MFLPRAAAACITGIMFPLYIYPGDNCAGWQPLIDTVNANPNLQVISIVNPNSGPGSGSQPDANYLSCIPKLRGSAGISKVIGYVSTDFDKQTKRSTEAINADVSTYAGWSTKLDGIFFDEVDTSQAKYNDYSGLVSNARSKSWAGSSYITLNPGTSVVYQPFYDLADSLITYESDYQSFSNSIINTSPGTPVAKQSVVLYGAPSVSESSSTIQTLVQQDHVGSIFVTDRTLDENPYGDFPSEWSSFVSTLTGLSC